MSLGGTYLLGTSGVSQMSLGGLTHNRTHTCRNHLSFLAIQMPSSMADLLTPCIPFGGAVPLVSLASLLGCHRDNSLQS